MQQSQYDPLKINKRPQISWSTRIYFMFLLFLFLLIIPVTKAIVYTGIPLIKNYRAQSWQPTTCTILKSELETRVDNSFLAKRGSHERTYRLNGEYQYQFNDKNYIGKRFHFVPIYSSGTGLDTFHELFTDKYSKNPAPVDLSPGQQVLCYVDPGNPSQSVIDRSYGMAYFYPMMSLCIVGIILIIVIALLIPIIISKVTGQKLVKPIKPPTSISALNALDEFIISTNKANQSLDNFRIYAVGFLFVLAVIFFILFCIYTLNGKI